MKRKEVEIERVEAIKEIIDLRKIATKLFRDTHIRGEIMHSILYQEVELIIELTYGLDKADDFSDAYRGLITKEKYLWCADVLEELAKVFREKGLDK